MSEDFRNSVRKLLADLTDKLLIKILIHGNSSDLGSLQTACDVLIRVVYTPSLDLSARLLDSFVQTPQRLFGALVKCPELMVRQFLSGLCSRACDTCLRADRELLAGKAEEKENSTVRRFLDMMLGFVGNDLAANWVRFGKFFEVLRSPLQSGSESEVRKMVVKYYLEKDLVATLLDFYLGKRSPFYRPQDKRYEMGSLAAGPDFDPLIDIVINLACSPDTELTPRAWQCLCSPDLISKYVREGGKIAKLKDMVLHLTRNQPRYSKMICKMLLAVVHDYEVYKFQQYFPLLCDTLAVEDSLQQQRIEWLLGVPQPETRSHLAAAYGLAATSSVDDDVVAYISPLKVSPRESPLLSQIWRHRNQYEYFTSQCLHGLLELVKRSGPVYEYVRHAPGPTYQYGRYLDWVGGFLDSYADIVSRFIDTQSRKEKEDLIAELRVMLSAINDRMAAEKDTAVPVPYAVGKFQKEQEVLSRKYIEHGLSLSVVDVTTELFASLPSPAYLKEYALVFATPIGTSTTTARRPRPRSPRLPVPISGLTHIVETTHASRVEDIEDDFMDVRGYPAGSPFGSSNDASESRPPVQDRKAAEETKMTTQEENEVPPLIPAVPVPQAPKVSTSSKKELVEYGSAIRKIEVTNSTIFAQEQHSIVGSFEGYAKVLIRPMKAAENSYFPQSWIKVHVSGVLYSDPLTMLHRSNLAWYLIKYDPKKPWDEIKVELRPAKHAAAGVMMDVPPPPAHVSQLPMLGFNEDGMDETLMTK